MVDLDPDFRHWSIRAFCLESGIVILAFVIMVVVFRWPVTATMMYFLILLMVIGAAAILITGRVASGR